MAICTHCKYYYKDLQQVDINGEVTWLCSRGGDTTDPCIDIECGEYSPLDSDSASRETEEAK